MKVKDDDKMHAMFKRLGDNMHNHKNEYFVNVVTLEEVFETTVKKILRVGQTCSPYT